MFPTSALTRMFFAPFRSLRSLHSAKNTGYAGVSDQTWNSMRFFIITSLLGLITSFVFHSLTFIGINLFNEYPAIGVLVIFWLFIIGLIAVMTMIKQSYQYNTPPFSLFNHKPKNGLIEIFNNMPKWLAMLCASIVVWGFVNFIITKAHSSVGTPTAIEGEYYLRKGSETLKQISFSEWRYQKLLDTRLIFGHIMIFYCLFYSILFTARLIEEKDT